MKKQYLLTISFLIYCAYSIAQTITSSSLEFVHCTPTNHTDTKYVRNDIFQAAVTAQGGYEWAGRMWTAAGTQESTLYDVRGCDSIVAYTLVVYTPCSMPFSISAGEQKIYFSSGNLQYLAKPATWRFALDQWEFFGEGEGNETAESNRSTQTKWIDLFGFGTSGEKYQPYQSQSSGYRCWLQYANITITGTNHDWGIKNNAVLGGFNPTWRTPTQEEWQYLVETNITKRGKATVNNVKGLILLPADWTLPEHCTFNSAATNFTTNVYSSTDEYETWNRMEAAGAVFLPMAGKRTGTDVTLNYGWYWATDCSKNWGTTASAKFVAAYLSFDGSELRVVPVPTTSSDAILNVYIGRAVRLIRNAQ